MPLNSFMNKIMIFNKHSYLIGDIISIFLTYILNSVYKLTGDTFITQIIRYSNVKGHGQFPFVGYLPSRDILGDNFNILSCKNYLLTINGESTIPSVLK